MVFRSLILHFWVFCAWHGVHASDLPSGNATIRSAYKGSAIVITTTDRLAGAIHSLTWNGREFINSTDHGRQLQSASNFDAGSRFTGETFNPTEAGSRADGAGPVSTSRLLHLIADNNRLQTTSQMAFWLRPGERSGGEPAKNRTDISNHLLTKRVEIGYRSWPNVIRYDVTFGLPVDEQHHYAQFEALTGYMPPEFEKFLTIDLPSIEPPSAENRRSARQRLAPLDDGPGEQNKPIIFCTNDEQHAMGIWSPQQPSPGFVNAGYGRWRFKNQKVVKWNCVFRIRRNADFVPAGDYSFRCFVIVGTLDDVAETMVQLSSSNPAAVP